MAKFIKQRKQLIKLERNKVKPKQIAFKFTEYYKLLWQLMFPFAGESGRNRQISRYIWPNKIEPRQSKNLNRLITIYKIETIKILQTKKRLGPIDLHVTIPVEELTPMLLKSFYKTERNTLKFILQSQHNSDTKTRWRLNKI